MLTTFFLGVNIPIIHCLKSRVEVVCRSMQFRESTRECVTHSWQSQRREESGLSRDKCSRNSIKEKRNAGYGFQQYNFQVI